MLSSPLSYYKKTLAAVGLCKKGFTEYKLLLSQ